LPSLSECSARGAWAVDSGDFCVGEIDAALLALPARELLPGGGHGSTRASRRRDVQSALFQAQTEAGKALTMCPMNSDEEALSGPEKDDETPCSDGDRPLVIQSENLLQGRREVWIEHGSEMYRLRVTANGKLYLTK